jgi:polysaccharide export outer membrane protein
MRNAPSCLLRRLSRPVSVLIALAGLLAVLPGCSTPEHPSTSAPRPAQQQEPIVLREGDVVKISFPGAPNLNATQPVRRDGRIALALVGEVVAAGKTPEALEKELVSLYANQLVMKEVNVTVEASSFPVYVTGVVLRPGKIDSNRPLTALEAIMEAGGFDYNRSNLKEVTVTRTANGRVEHFKLNLKRVLEGKDPEPFYLKPSDIIYVPERFTWF